MKLKISYIALVLLLTSLLTACVQQEEIALTQGTISFSIGQVSKEVSTRATPAQLGKPIADMFTLRLERTKSGRVSYEGKFVESLDVTIGEYDVTATCGENVLLGKDAPYYIGQAHVDVKAEQTNTVKIPCRVGNALVSVTFGRNDAERERFNRYYSDYGLLVRIGDYSMAISKDETASSIYFPAGSSPEFVFYGTLNNEAAQIVSTNVSHKNLPSVFEAADHASITITLPDPESALAVNVAKVEVEKVNLDETIPLSWLPVPSVTALHSYNTKDVLQGTNLSFSNTYPEMTWEARVSTAQGDTIRTTVGTGELRSEYSSSAEWPYLPAGKYKATFYLHTEEGVSKVSSREFVVERPKLVATIDGYTSYDKYLEGDIEAANGADGFTLYQPSVKVNIASKLLGIPHYGYKMTYTFNGVQGNVSDNAYNLGTATLDARLEPYNLSLSVEFDGQSLSESRNFYITGIPFLFAPPTTATWEKSGDVTDEGEYARFGNWSTGSQSLTYNKVAIPAGTRLSFDYKFMTTGDATNTFTIYAGEQTLVSSGKVSGYAKPTFENVDPVTITSGVSYVRCYNSYGAGLSRTDLYRVGLEYRQ